MQNNFDSVKLTSLKLSTMSWWDRRWVLKRIPKNQKLKVKSALKELSKLGIENKKELLAQLSNNTQEEIGISPLALSSNLNSHIQLLLTEPSAKEFNVSDSSRALLAQLNASLSEKVQ